MSTMTIRKLDPDLKARLRVRAAQHGKSMEEEARDILRAALSTGVERGATVVDFIRKRVEPLGGAELEIPSRDAMREPPSFDR